MSDHWSFWKKQLAGEQPETTPGQPHSGFFTNKRRYTVDNPEPRPGEPRKKIRYAEEAIAIWHDKHWHCVIRSKETTRYLDDTDAIDEVFSRVCRNAIDYGDFEQLVRDMEKVSENQ